MTDHAHDDDHAPDATPKRNGPISLAERASIIGLALGGLSGREIARRTGRHRNSINQVLDSPEAHDARQLAKDVLTSRAVEYAELHWRASQKASEKGDTRGIEWALDRLGVVEPPRVQGATGGIHVQIGVLLPGLPPPPNASPGAPLAIMLPATTGDTE